MADLTPALIIDSTTVTDVVADIVRASFISVSDEVAVSESDDVRPTIVIYTDPRDEYKLKWPTWSLDAETGTPATLSAKGPMWDAVGYGGSALTERIPDYGLAAAGQEHPIASLRRNTPTWSLTGRFGANLSEKIPTWSVAATIAEHYMSLRKVMPGWEISAEISSPWLMTLREDTPFWELTGSVKEDGHLTLDATMPFWRVEVVFLAGWQLTLAEKEPFWELTATIDCRDMSLDVAVPIWVMNVGTGDDIGGRADPGSIVDTARFEDYILQHTRP